VVFPAVIEQLGEDMRDVAERLARIKTGVLTQTMEEEIATTLEDIVGAVERKLEEMKQQGKSSQQSQSPQDQPLLPTSAELKLLKSMQVRVLSRTRAIETEREAGKLAGEELLKTTEHLTERQKEASEIAREMRDLEEGQ